MQNYTPYFTINLPLSLSKNDQYHLKVKYDWLKLIRCAAIAQLLTY